MLTPGGGALKFPPPSGAVEPGPAVFKPGPKMGPVRMGPVPPGTRMGGLTLTGLGDAGSILGTPGAMRMGGVRGGGATGVAAGFAKAVD